MSLDRRTLIAGLSAAVLAPRAARAATVTDGAGRWRPCRLVGESVAPDGEVGHVAAGAPVTVAVAPPKGDRWGPGSRIPAIIVSPFAKKATVDHSFYDTTSILATIERRFDVAPLSSRDAAVHDLSRVFHAR